MRKLEAAMHDASARKQWSGRGFYKVGSYFKGCMHCGETIEEELPSGRTVVRYLSGHDVFRSYCPKQMGWTYYCWTCSAKDAKCWENAGDIGQDAIRGVRDAVHERRAEMRKNAARNDVPRTPQKTSEIRALEAKIAALMEIVRLEAEIKKLKGE